MHYTSRFFTLCRNSELPFGKVPIYIITSHTDDFSFNFEKFCTVCIRAFLPHWHTQYGSLVRIHHSSEPVFAMSANFLNVNCPTIYYFVCLNITLDTRISIRRDKKGWQAASTFRSWGFAELNSIKTIFEIGADMVCTLLHILVVFYTLVYCGVAL